MSGYLTLRFRITGVSPLLLHNGRLADPLDPMAKAMAQVAAKRRKTDADHRRLAELEFKASLYLEGGHPCIPAEMMEAALVKAAGLERRGPKAKAGLVVRDNLLLDYDGPRDVEALWQHGGFVLRTGVRVGAVRVMRTRPRLPEWQADLAVDYLPHLLNAADITSFLEVAGEQIGIGDWRPRFGRFAPRSIPDSGEAAGRRHRAAARAISQGTRPSHGGQE